MNKFTFIFYCLYFLIFQYSWLDSFCEHLPLFPAYFNSTSVLRSQMNSLFMRANVCWTYEIVYSLNVEDGYTRILFNLFDTIKLAFGIWGGFLDF